MFQNEYLTNRAVNVLHRVGFTSLEEVAKCSEDEVAKIRGMNDEAMQSIKAAFTEAGLSFAADRTNYIEEHLNKEWVFSSDHCLFVDAFVGQTLKAVLRDAGLESRSDFAELLSTCKTWSDAISTLEQKTYLSQTGCVEVLRALDNPYFELRLKKNLSVLNLPDATLSLLNWMAVTTVRDLVNCSAEDLNTSLWKDEDTRNVREALTRCGLSLRGEPAGFLAMPTLHFPVAEPTR